MRLIPVGFLWVLTLLGGCTAHYPVNDKIQHAEPKLGYYVDDPRATRRSESLLVVLAFSGGGTRAAAFSYGVLEKLARTEIIWDGRRRRLLDEVDLISSVSGGSFTAAYYGLFGDRIFEDFEEKFLKKDVQSALSALLLSPTSWPSLWSSGGSDKGSGATALNYETQVRDTTLEPSPEPSPVEPWKPSPCRCPPAVRPLTKTSVVCRRT